MEKSSGMRLMEWGGGVTNKVVPERRAVVMPCGGVRSQGSLCPYAVVRGGVTINFCWESGGGMVGLVASQKGPEVL